jgi:hypothetical protein
MFSPPANIRKQLLLKQQKNVDTAVMVPGWSEMIKGNIAVVTNWSSFKEELHFPECG